MKGFLLWLAIGPVHALCQYPSLIDYKHSEITATRFEYKGCFLNSECYKAQAKSITEVPPWMVDGGWRTYFFVDGRGSVLWSSAKSLTTNSAIDLKHYANGPHTVTRPYVMEPDFSRAAKQYDWRRNYHAIFSAQVIHHRTAGDVTLGFCHSENKNEVWGNCLGGVWLLNTIQANTPIECNDHLTWSGGQPYSDGWKAYNGLLTGVWTPYTKETDWGQQLFPHDLGPIAWPATGYVTPSGVKCTSGLRHPSSILRGDSIYIFFVDGGPYGDNIPEEEGRKGGVKVLRVHKDDALRAQNYTIYYHDPQGGEHWLPSLPAGFTKETMLDYVAVKGPSSTSLFNDTGAYYQDIRFSVARLKDHSGYVGVEQYVDFSDLTADRKPHWKVALRFSTDLLNWSGRQLVVYTADSWEASQMNYPIFLNKEGTSNTEVDANEFFVLGTEHTPDDHVNKIRVFDPAFRPHADPGAPALMMLSSPAVPVTGSVDVLAFPNPVEATLNVRLQVPLHSRVRLDLVSMDGRRLKSLCETSGSRTFNASFDLSSCAAGMYLLECVVGEEYVYARVVKQ